MISRLKNKEVYNGEVEREVREWEDKNLDETLHITPDDQEKVQRINEKVYKGRKIIVNIRVTWEDREKQVKVGTLREESITKVSMKVYHMVQSQIDTQVFRLIHEMGHVSVNISIDTEGT